MPDGILDVPNGTSQPVPNGNGNEVATAQPPVIPRSESYNKFLLTVKLEEYRNNPEKIYGYAVDLQARCRELSSTQRDDLDRSHSGTSSRRTTDDTLMKAKRAALQASRNGTLLVFDQVNSEVEEKPWKTIKGMTHLHVLESAIY
jgi:hypothetical protein